MAKFITGQELVDTVDEIILRAEEKLLLLSPYIKLDKGFKNLFDNHINNPKLHFLIVFGKNENDVSKSLSKADFEYFKKFPNISIIYVHNLHAKYYGNERMGVITSINLYDYSFKNNIEFGVFSETSIMDSFTTSTDNEAWDTCHQIAEHGEVVFIRRPVYEKKLLSAFFGKNYKQSDILFDDTEKFYNKDQNVKYIDDAMKLFDYPDELENGYKIENIPTKQTNKSITTGFCIRSGEKIQYNLKKPYSEKSFKSWVQFGNINYPEKFCHKTGQESKGKTSMKSPIL
jgi:hypothetical protein